MLFCRMMEILHSTQQPYYTHRIKYAKSIYNPTLSRKNLSTACVGTPSVIIFLRMADSGSFIFNMRWYMASTAKLSTVFSASTTSVTSLTSFLTRLLSWSGGLLSNTDASLDFSADLSSIRSSSACFQSNLKQRAI